MYINIVPLMAFMGGVFLALQGTLNARLGVRMGNPILASLVAFSCSAVIVFIYVLFSKPKYVSFEELKNIPLYLWFTGGLCSVVGISMYYYTIPKLGAANMISIGLCGQLIFSVVASHFGWFELPVDTVSIKKIGGLMAMILGVLLINLK